MKSRDQRVSVGLRPKGRGSILEAIMYFKEVCDTHLSESEDLLKSHLKRDGLSIII